MYVALRALGWVEPVPPPIPVSRRLSDPTGDAITHALTSKGLWRYDQTMELERNGSRLTVRIFLPEINQADRADSHIEANATRQALTEALNAEGYVVRFADAFWSDRGHRGWSVLVKAQERG